ncbi:vacuolar protein sorting-associated protein 33B-like isoform X2 [Uloborus diversus]|nr:vacuolar protein sorting-associated protein 33B-like isoform X2 [Uloborus diversus]
MISSLDFILSFSLLKKCNVEKVFKLTAGSSPGESEKCVYLVRPTIEYAKIIVEHVKADEGSGKKRKYFIINVPRKLHTCEVAIEEEGAYGFIQQMEFPLGFLNRDKDLLSLEMSDFYRRFYLDGDLTNIYSAASALVQLCRICGPIKNIFGQGRCAQMVVDMMDLMMGKKCDSINADGISHLIILDRDIDYVSVLLSQLTYEGIIDETFGINSGRVIFPKEVSGKEPMKVTLNSGDLIFEEIRNSYFASVFGLLREKAKELQSKSETSGMSLGDMKEFVSKEVRKIRQEHAALTLHIGACEVILDQKQADNLQDRLQIERSILENQNIKDAIIHTEDTINKQDPYASALRLMCLLSICQDGLFSTDYQTLAKQFRQSYGSKYIITLNNLKKTGLLLEQSLLPPSTGKVSKLENKANFIAEKVVSAVAFPRYSSFRAVAKKFNLIPVESDPSDLKRPKNMSYVFGGAYVPLVGRITEEVIATNDFGNIEEGLKLLPGNTIVRKAKNTPSEADARPKTIMVYVLGGITYAEVAALRLLGQLHNCCILIATTSFLNGNSLMKELSYFVD